MTKEHFDYFEELSIDETPDVLRGIEDEVREIIYEDAKYTGASDDDCAKLFSDWIIKNRLSK